MLYLQYSHLEASPKAISERTSYLQVRLEFLRYPHLIPALFNVRGFGPPSSVTWTSSWTWVDHLVSGLRPHTHSPYSDSLSLRLRLLNLTLAWTTRVSNPVCSPRFRASVSVTDQKVAFATGVPPNLYAFHRYTWNSTFLFCTQVPQFPMTLHG